MEQLKYKVIKTRKQYNEYCNTLENLVTIHEKSRAKNIGDEIELLTFLIEKWDGEHNSFVAQNPVELLKSLMAANNLKPQDMTKILGVSKGLVSGILNYRRGLSKENIRILSSHFNVSQEAFNRPYKLANEKDLSIA
jgi:HTH-type transcriptional regulator/antitoxin HigA